MVALAFVLAALLALAAVIVGVLLARARRAQHVDDTWARYQPTSADPRGRWRITRQAPDLLVDTRYVLHTDHDGPDRWPRPPISRPRPTPETVTQQRNNRTRKD